MPAPALSGLAGTAALGRLPGYALKEAVDAACRRCGRGGTAACATCPVTVALRHLPTGGSRRRLSWADLVHATLVHTGPADFETLAAAAHALFPDRLAAPHWRHALRAALRTDRRFAERQGRFALTVGGASAPAPPAATRWDAAVRQALVRLGGEAELPALYAEVARRQPARCAANPLWQNRVRGVLQDRRHFRRAGPGRWAIAAATLAGETA